MELRRLKAERKKIELLPKPEKSPTNLSGWVAETQALLKAKMQETAASIAHKASVECETVFSPETFKTQVGKVFRANLSNEIEAPLLLQFLPFLKEQMEAVLLTREVKNFERRFESIDGEIRRWEANTPKPFSPEMINVDSRFPVVRIGFMQERAYDKYLTDALKSKPIFFDSPDYVDKLILFYETVYKPQADAELKAKEQANPKVEVKPEPAKVEMPPQNITRSDSYGTLAGDTERAELFASRHPRNWR